MKLKSKTEKTMFVLVAIADVALVVLCAVQVAHPVFSFGNYGLFNAKGAVAAAQGRLIVTALLLMLLLAIPVPAVGFFIAFKYRDGKNQAYEPDWGDRHKYLQPVWWACPGLIIALLSIINFQSAHALDPTKSLNSNLPPLTIQVVALRWKWLFIYPDQHIATVNYVEFPAGTPVNFELTADGPMSLFWIPQLGGEMAAMTGMVNHLNLMADQTGTFPGQNSEINGQGYDGMTFTVNSTSQNDFNAWVTSVKQSSPQLTADEYAKLAQPSQNNPPAMYSSTDENLYNNVIQKYVYPSVPHE